MAHDENTILNDPPDAPAPDEVEDQLPIFDAAFDGLSDKEQKAIVALLQQPTVAEAAKSVGMGTRTLYRWMAKHHFDEALRKARRAWFAQAIALTQRYAPLAINTIAKVMMDPASATTARVSAATTILKFGRESIELDDLQARIEKLEQAAAKRQSAMAGRGGRWN